VPGRGRPPRSYLYVPGDSRDKLAKALARGADAIIVDLEDAIAPDRRTEARETVREWLAALEQPNQTRVEIWARINSGATGEADLASVFCSVLTGICVPKVRGPDELREVQEQLRQMEAKTPGAPRLAIQPLIETASALLAAEQIARVEGVRLMQLGEYDLGAELGLERSSDDKEFLLARSQLVLASAAAGARPPVGPVFADFLDLEKFRASTLALKRLGYRSRACVHPAQVGVVNEVFTPASPEIERARSLVDAFEHVAAQGLGVFRDENGAMVDEAVVRAARRLLEESG
jgi:citrate lyase subunit beta / citryl-CoA lyase